MKPKKRRPPPPQKPIDLAVKAAGSVAQLARLMDLDPRVVHNWVKRPAIPATQVLAVERASGVPRGLLRPDLYPSGPGGI